MGRRLPHIFWLCALVAIAAWGLQPSYVVGWDLAIYKAAMLSLRAGHDPYLDATNIQRLFHAQWHPPGTPVPYSYVYSPITLPLLGVIARLPFHLSAALYWIVYAIALFTPVAVGYFAAEGRNERTVFALLAPMAVFFPGMLEQDAFFSGNIAYILYGAMLATAMLGWKRGMWGPFYLAVLASSCVKAPLLSLAVIPVLSARRQWMPTFLTIAAGVGLFALQPHVWPTLFHNYLTAVELQFSYNKDFSTSPAGLLAKRLYNVVPYQITSAVAYGIYALLIAAVLLRLRVRFLAGAFSLRQWVPVMLVGTILLNPRIMEYDVAPITLMMALVAWRFIARNTSSQQRTIAVMAALFLLINGLVALGAFVLHIDLWRPTEGVLLTLTFAVGAWMLSRAHSEHAGKSTSAHLDVAEVPGL